MILNKIRINGTGSKKMKYARKFILYFFIFTPILCYGNSITINGTECETLSLKLISLATKRTKTPDPYEVFFASSAFKKISQEHNQNQMRKRKIDYLILGEIQKNFPQLAHPDSKIQDLY
jgi:hypothetical protein